MSGFLVRRGVCSNRFASCILLLLSIADVTNLSAQVPPVILRHPESTIVGLEDVAEFLVDARGGAGAVSYQWDLRGTNVPLAASPTVRIRARGVQDVGYYAATVGNVFGLTTSSNAALSIRLPRASTNNQWDIILPKASASSVVVDRNDTIHFAGTLDVGSRVVNGVEITNSRSMMFFATASSAGQITRIDSPNLTSLGASTGQALAVDSFGNTYIAGRFTGRLSIGTKQFTDADGFADVYLVKYDASQQLQWAIVARSEGPCTLRGIAVDDLGNCFLTGGFSTALTWGTTRLQNTSTNNAQDFYLMKCDSAGVVRWARSGGGPGIESGAGVTVDSLGYSYVIGDIGSGARFASVLFQSSGILLAKYDPQGELAWARTVSTLGDHVAHGIARDGVGNVYGTASSTLSASLAPGLTTPADGGTFVFKISEAGVPLWLNPVEGNAFHPIVADPWGGILVGGADPSDPITQRPTVFDAAGRLMAIYGSSDSGGRIFRSMGSESLGGIVTAGSVGEDAIVRKIWRGGILAPPIVLAQPLSYPALPGASATLTASATGTAPLYYQWMFQGNSIPGATSNTFFIPGVDQRDLGAYSMAVSNAFGAVTSAVARLDILSPSPDIVVVGTGTVERVSPIGPVVSFLARPSPGNLFLYWRGVTNGTSNPINVRLVGGGHLVAVFTSPSINVSVVGEGEVVKSPDKSAYTLGESVQLTAIPAHWMEFSSWSDGVTKNPRAVTLGSNNSYRAFFLPTTPLETLTFGQKTRRAPVGMPAILFDGEFGIEGPVNRAGSSVVSLLSSFTHAILFYTLDGTTPSFDSLGYEGPFTLHRSAKVRALAYDANFLQAWECDPARVIIVPTFVVQTRTRGGGVVSLSPVRTEYLSNTLVTVTAAPDAGWSFLHWLGDSTDTQAVVTVRVGGRDLCLEAVFATKLTTHDSIGGQVLREPVQEVYPYGSKVRLSCVPDVGFSFGAWGNAVGGTRNPLELTITNALPEVSALFGALSKGQQSLQAIPRGSGTVGVSALGNHFITGRLIKLTAKPNLGQTFLGWSGDASGMSPELAITLDKSRLVFADFTKHPYLELNDCSGTAGSEAFQFVVSGPAGERVVIESSTDLEHWVAVDEVLNITGRTLWSDPLEGTRRTTFYRAR